MTKSNQACIKYSPKCILQFLSDSPHMGETCRIIYKEILLSIDGCECHFSAFESTSQQKSPKPGTYLFYHPPPPPHPILQNKSRRHMNLVFNNKFPHSIDPPQQSASQITTSKIYWSPQARFLIAGSRTSNYKVIKIFHMSAESPLAPTIISYRTPGWTVTYLLHIDRENTCD